MPHVFFAHGGSVIIHLDNTSAVGTVVAATAGTTLLARRYASGIGGQINRLRLRMKPTVEVSAPTPAHNVPVPAAPAATASAAPAVPPVAPIDHVRMARQLLSTLEIPTKPQQKAAPAAEEARPMAAAVFIPIIAASMNSLPYLIAGIQAIEGNARTGATKKQLTLQAIGLAGGEADQLLTGGNKALADAAAALVSAAIDDLVSDFKTREVFGFKKAT